MFIKNFWKENYGMKLVCVHCVDLIPDVIPTINGIHLETGRSSEKQSGNNDGSLV